MPILCLADLAHYRKHPNGGGYVCHASEVDDQVYLNSMVVVRNSTIRGETRIEGDFEICNSFIRDSKILVSPDDELTGGKLIDAHLSACTLIGNIEIENCFIKVSEAQSMNQGFVVLKNLMILASYFGGDVRLLGIPKNIVKVPQPGCPLISCTHLEGTISMEIPVGTKIHSTVIKPESSPRRAHPNKNVLLQLIESLPAAETQHALAT